MNRKFSAVKEQVHSRLLSPPHVVDKIVDFLMDGWKPDAAEQEMIMTHIVGCSDCSTALHGLLYIVEQYEKANEDAEAIHEILTNFVSIHDQIEAQRYEQMAMYAEAIMDKGKEIADSMFPILAKNMESNADCKKIMENMLAAFKEDKETT